MFRRRSQGGGRRRSSAAYAPLDSPDARATLLHTSTTSSTSASTPLGSSLRDIKSAMASKRSPLAVTTNNASRRSPAGSPKPKAARKVSPPPKPIVVTTSATTTKASPTPRSPLTPRASTPTTPAAASSAAAIRTRQKTPKIKARADLVFADLAEAVKSATATTTTSSSSTTSPSDKRQSRVLVLSNSPGCSTTTPSPLRATRTAVKTPKIRRRSGVPAAAPTGLVMSPTTPRASSPARRQAQAEVAHSAGCTPHTKATASPTANRSIKAESQPAAASTSVAAKRRSRKLPSAPKPSQPSAATAPKRALPMPPSNSKPASSAIASPTPRARAATATSKTPSSARYHAPEMVRYTIPLVQGSLQIGVSPARHGKHGLRVDKVAPGSPCEGLLFPGDRIVAVGVRYFHRMAAAKQMSFLQDTLAKHPPTIDLGVIHEGQPAAAVRPARDSVVVGGGDAPEPSSSVDEAEKRRAAVRASLRALQHESPETAAADSSELAISTPSPVIRLRVAIPPPPRESPPPDIVFERPEAPEPLLDHEQDALGVPENDGATALSAKPFVPANPAFVKPISPRNTGRNAASTATASPRRHVPIATRTALFPAAEGCTSSPASPTCSPTTRGPLSPLAEVCSSPESLAGSPVRVSANRLSPCPSPTLAGMSLSLLVQPSSPPMASPSASFRLSPVSPLVDQQEIVAATSSDEQRRRSGSARQLRHFPGRIVKEMDLIPEAEEEEENEFSAEAVSQRASQRAERVQHNVALLTRLHELHIHLNNEYKRGREELQTMRAELVARTQQRKSAVGEVADENKKELANCNSNGKTSAAEPKKKAIIAPSLPPAVGARLKPHTPKRPSPLCRSSSAGSNIAATVLSQSTAVPSSTLSAAVVPLAAFVAEAESNPAETTMLPMSTCEMAVQVDLSENSDFIREQLEAMRSEKREQQRRASAAALSPSIARSPTIRLKPNPNATSAASSSLSSSPTRAKAAKKSRRASTGSVLPPPTHRSDERPVARTIYLGRELSSLGINIAGSVKDGVDQGIFVSKVLSTAPGNSKLLRSGDQIIEINGANIQHLQNKTATNLIKETVRSKGPVTFKVLRWGGPTSTRRRSTSSMGDMASAASGSASPPGTASPLRRAMARASPAGTVREKSVQAVLPTSTKKRMVRAPSLLHASKEHVRATSKGPLPVYWV